MDLSKLPSVTFNDVLNDTQFCYHLVYPKFFNLAKKQNRTQTSGTTNRQPGAVKNEKKRRRRGRPRKEEVAATKRSEEARRAPIENTTTDDKSDANRVQCTKDSFSHILKYLILIAINRHNFNAIHSQVHAHDRDAYQDHQNIWANLLKLEFQAYPI